MGHTFRTPDVGSCGYVTCTTCGRVARPYVYISALRGGRAKVWLAMRNAKGELAKVHAVRCKPVAREEAAMKKH